MCLASDKCCSFFALLEKILLSSVSRDQIRSARARGACLNTRAINLLVLVEISHIAIKKMVLQPTVLPVSVDQLNVLLIPASIAIKPSILAIKYLAVIQKVKPLIPPLVVAVQQIVLLIQMIPVYSVSNQAMVQEVVIRLLIQLLIQKLKVVHVVRYLEELILRIKQRVIRLQIILV